MPGLAGFFSKDEILWRTFANGHWILWTIGVLTSLLTATYMFRLVFLTFHGERRPASRCGSRRTRPMRTTRTVRRAIACGYGAPAAHGHLHDAPPAMAVVL